MCYTNQPTNFRTSFHCLWINSLIIISLLFIAVNNTSGQSRNMKHSDGCGAGYWKNHTYFWDESSDALSFSLTQVISSLGGLYGGNATTSDSYSATFGLSATQMSDAGLDPSLTLQGAINLPGGQLSALARQSVAALLNSVAVNFQYSPNEIIQRTHDGIVTHNFATFLDLLEKSNDGDCIKLPALPQSCLITGQSLACTEAGAIPYIAHIDNSNGPVYYQWSLINNTTGAGLSGTVSGLSSGSSINVFVVPLAGSYTPGAFSLQLTISRGVEIQTCLLPVTIFVLHPLTLTVSTVPVQGDPGFPTVIQINASASGGIQPYTFLWADSTTGGTSGAIFSNPVGLSTSVTVFHAGTYRFSLRVNQASGCSASAIVSITVDANGNTLRQMANQVLRFICCGLINPDFTHPDHVTIKEEALPVRDNTEIHIFPNPNNGMFTVSLPSVFGSASIIITDIFGNIIQKWSGIQSPTRQIKIDHPGVYLIRIMKADTHMQVIKKVVVLQ